MHLSLKWQLAFGRGRCRGERWVHRCRTSDQKTGRAILDSDGEYTAAWHVSTRPTYTPLKFNLAASRKSVKYSTIYILWTKKTPNNAHSAVLFFLNFSIPKWTKYSDQSLSKFKFAISFFIRLLPYAALFYLFLRTSNHMFICACSKQKEKKNKNIFRQSTSDFPRSAYLFLAFSGSFIAFHFSTFKRCTIFDIFIGRWKIGRERCQQWTNDKSSLYIRLHEALYSQRNRRSLLRVFFLKSQKRFLSVPLLLLAVFHVPSMKDLDSWMAHFYTILCTYGQTSVYVLNWSKMVVLIAKST